MSSESNPYAGTRIRVCEDCEGVYLKSTVHKCNARYEWHKTRDVRAKLIEEDDRPEENGIFYSSGRGTFRLAYHWKDCKTPVTSFYTTNRADAQKKGMHPCGHCEELSWVNCPRCGSEDIEEDVQEQNLGSEYEPEWVARITAVCYDCGHLEESKKRGLDK